MSYSYSMGKTCSLCGEAQPIVEQRTIPAEKPTYAPLRNVIVYLEGGVVQDVTVPAGVEVTVIDQDEIECGEQGTFTYEGEPEVNHAAQLAEALRDVMADLDHYVATHGPGPDKRRDAAKQALAAYESEGQS